MNVELYFNDQLADFDNEDVIAGTYAINKLGELKSRQGYYTNTYNLPLSHRNKQIFGSAEIINNLSTAPYSLFTHRVLIEGVEVFNGFAKIEKAKDVYEVTGFAGNADFFTLIKDKSIKDLDLSAWDHIRDDATVAASWANTEGYNYAFTDHGKYRAVYDDTVDVQDLYPSVFFKTIIDQIASEAGYELSGNVLSHPRYQKMVIPFNEHPLSVNGPEFQGRIQSFVSPNNDAYQILIFEELSDDDNFYDDLGFFTIPKTINLDLELTIYGLSTGGLSIIELVRRPGSDSTNFPESANDEILLTIPVTGNGEISSGKMTDESGATFFEGDRLFFRVKTLSSGTSNTIVSDDLSITTVQKGYDIAWVVADNLPDIQQDKFFLEFMMQFGLIPFPDVESGIIHLVYMDDIEKNSPVDWSKKIDDSEEPEVTYRFDSYAQSNKLTYKTDDVLTDGFDHDFLIADATLEKEKPAFESQFFLPSELSTVARSLFTKSFIEQSFTTFRGKWISSAEYEEGDVVFRKINPDTGPDVFAWWKAKRDNNNVEANLTNTDDWERVEESDVWDISGRPIIGVLETDQAITVEMFDGTAECTQFVRGTGMTWTEIYEEHYQLFAVVIQKTLIAKLLLKLNYSDINQLDLTRPIYIKQFGCFFYCDIVEQFKFNETDSTYVTLIRM